MSESRSEAHPDSRAVETRTLVLPLPPGQGAGEGLLVNMRVDLAGLTPAEALRQARREVSLVLAGLGGAAFARLSVSIFRDAGADQRPRTYLCNVDLPGPQRVFERSDEEELEDALRARPHWTPW